MKTCKRAAQIEVNPRGDRACREVSLLEPERIGTGFRNFDRFSVTHRCQSNGTAASFEREVLRSGLVVGVLPVDLTLSEFVLISQFRLGGHLGADLGMMTEIVAGRVDDGESLEDAARRECCEEIGALPQRLVPLFDFAPAPALTDEYMRLFLAVIDAGALPTRAGVSDEDIAVLRYNVSEVTSLLPCVHSGPTLIALQWLAANRNEIDSHLH
jgi:ADP-ribose pyrophosphatase